MFTTPLTAPSVRASVRAMTRSRSLTAATQATLVALLLCSVFQSATPTIHAAPATADHAQLADASSAVSLEQRTEARHAALRAALHTHARAVHILHTKRVIHHVAHVAHVAHAANTHAHPLVMSGRLCTSPQRFPAVITQWTTPVSCYRAIYHPNPAAYVARPSYGWCNWWPEVTHPQVSGYAALHLTAHAQPVMGAVVWFAPGVQGASSEGHYAVVEGIGPNGWLLISEMNFFWRGGGFGLVDYRYVHTGPGVVFRY